MVKINARLLPIKAHYFFFLAAMGPILPFLPVIGKQIGISEIVMGAINAFLPIFFLLIKPFFGFLIDYFQKQRKKIFLAILIVTGISYALMIFIPYRKNKIVNCKEISSCIDRNRTEIKWCNLTCDRGFVNTTVDAETLCSPQLNLTCQVPNSQCLIHCSDSEFSNFYSGVAFWSFVFLMSLGTIGYNVANSLSDAICFDVLGKGNEMEYGKQRVWGTIGFGMTALLGGLSIDIISRDSHYKDYTPGYLIALFCLLLDLFSTSKLVLPPLPKSNDILKDMAGLVKKPHVVAFLAFATLVGICDSSMIFYLLWYLEDLAESTGQLENIKLLEGLTVAAETLIGEVIFFAISGWVLAKLGYGHSLSMCFFLYSVRLGLVATITNPWLILPIEMVMQGPTYALTYTTIVAYACAITPPGTSGTMQGLVAGFDDGFGYAIGSLLTGYLYKVYGGRMMYLQISCLALVSSILHFILYMLFFRKSAISPRDSYQPAAVIYETTALQAEPTLPQCQQND